MSITKSGLIGAPNQSTPSIGSTFAGVCWLRPDHWLRPVLGWSVVVTGLIGVLCSVMIYVVTGREFWNFTRTAWKFGLTSVVLGIAATWLSILVFGIYFKVSILNSRSAQP